MDGAILLTGATGLLGRYLLRDLTVAGHRVAVLVRPSARQPADARVAALLAAWDQRGYGDLPAPQVLTGDITSPGLGLSDTDARWAEEHCDLVLHNAASLTFFADPAEPGEPWRSNVEGTRNVLGFARDAGIADFHHVSTAYVAGLRTGVVREDDGDVGQEFGNDYEKSKLQAEALVRAADFLETPTVYRPSIIVGDSETGFTTTFHGFYAVVKLAHALARLVDVTEGGDSADWSLPLHGLTGDERKNLVPVDWVSAAIAEIVGRRDCWGKTYHLTPAEPVRADVIRDVVEEVVGHHGRSAFGGQAAAGEAAALSAEVEAAFYEQMKVYETYLRNDPTFDRTNLLAAFDRPCPPLDREHLLMLARTAAAMNFRYRDPNPAKLAAR